MTNLQFALCKKKEHNRVQLCFFLQINQCWSVALNWSNMHIIRSRMDTNWSSRQFVIKEGKNQYHYVIICRFY